MKVGIFTTNAGFLEAVKRELGKYHNLYIWYSTGDTTIDLVNLNHILSIVDVAYFDWCQTPFPQALIMLPWMSCKRVVRARGLPFFYVYDQIHWEQIDAVVGHQLIKWKLETLPEDKQPKQFFEFPAGTDVDSFKLSPNKTYGKNLLVHSTVIRFRKRVYTTIQTFYELLKHDKEWTLHIVGNWEKGWRAARRKEYFEPAQELIKILKIEDNLKLYDHMPKSKWRDFLRDKDIMISNGIREGTHVSLAEAMLTGVYPIINCWLGASNYYPQNCVFYTQTEMVEKILEWSKLPIIDKQRLSIEMHDWAYQRYNEKKIAVEIRKIIEGVVDD